MKRFLCVSLAFCLFLSLWNLSGCQQEKDKFILTEEKITEALASSGLSGTISETETTSYAEGHIQYTIRDSAQTCEISENSRFIASAASANQHGGRILYTTFDQPVSQKQIVWEDWKPQILFAALLYGGFEDPEEVYQAFLGKTISEDAAAAQWSAPLFNGYCVISYSLRNNSTYDEEGFQVVSQSACLRVNIYESQALYQKITAE